MSETKQCRRCGAVKETNQFCDNPKTKDGLMHMCKECWKEVNPCKLKPFGTPQQLFADCDVPPRKCANLSVYEQEKKAMEKLNSVSIELLFAELKRRGYSGTLTLHKEVTL